MYRVDDVSIEQSEQYANPRENNLFVKLKKVLSGLQFSSSEKLLRPERPHTSTKTPTRNNSFFINKLQVNI